MLTKEILTLKKNQRIKKNSKNYPNPFRKDNTIISSIPEGEDSKVIIYPTHADTTCFFKSLLDSYSETLE